MKGLNRRHPVHSEATNLESNEVSVVRVTSGSIEGAVREAVSLMGGMNRIVKKGRLSTHGE